MNPPLRLLGWNSLQIFLGEGEADRIIWEQVSLDWKLSDIRNCSFAPGLRWIGFTAEDQSGGDQILGIFEERTGLSRVLRRFDYVLHHALNRAGTKVCYTQPSTTRGAADLYLYDLQDGGVRLLLSGGIAQDSVPSWFPDEEQVAYHTPDGYLAVSNIRDGSGRRLTAGRSPAVSPTGTRIAFQRGAEIFLWAQAAQEAERVDLRRGVRKKQLVDGLSWASDEQHLSFAMLAGLSDKETTFHLVSLLEGEVSRIEARYLQGLIIL